METKTQEIEKDFSKIGEEIEEKNSENDRKGFIFYRNFYENIKKLKKKDQLAVYEAIATYSFSGEIIELSGISEIVFSLIKPQLEANNEKYKNGKKTKQTISKTEANDKQTISKTEANDKQTISKTEAKEERIKKR